MDFDLEVLNEWFAQGEIRVGARKFWYKCDSGRQYLAELDTASDNEFAELDATCMCEVVGRLGHSSEKVNPCENVWDSDPKRHFEDASKMLALLLNKRR